MAQYNSKYLEHPRKHNPNASLRPRPKFETSKGLRIAGDNRVQWRFDNVEINLNLSLTGILELNFVSYILLTGKFEITLSLPKQHRK